MTYLDAAIRRCRLNIGITYIPGIMIAGQGYIVFSPPAYQPECWYMWDELPSNGGPTFRSASEATRAYLALCAELERAL